MIRVDRFFAGIASSIATGLAFSLFFGLVPWLLGAILFVPFLLLFTILAKVTTLFYDDRV